MQQTVRAALAGWPERWRSGSAPGPVPGLPAFGVLGALGVSAALVSLVSGSPWPAAVLPPVAAGMGALPVPSRLRRLGVGAAALLAVGLGVATTSLVPALGLALASLVAVAAAFIADRERHDAMARMAAAHELVDAVSVIDEVTGCYNANGLDLLAQHVLSSVRRASGAMHASLVEIADLSAIAEAGGEDAVREVVCALADALRASTRGADVVGRWSPEVFVVLGPGTGVPPAEMERRLRARLLSASGRPATRWAAAVTVGSGMLEPWDSGGLADLVARAEQDLGLRRALRSPSAPQPSRRRRRASDRAGERPAPER